MASLGASTAYRYTRNSLALAVLLAALLFFSRQRTGEAAGRTSRVPFYTTADFTAEWISPSEPGYASIHRIGPFSLKNQEGEVITNDSLRGKIYVANFFFSRCTSLCPKMLRNLREIQHAFRDEPSVVLVSHSVMPSVDSEPVLRSFARANGVTSGKWHLLTGDKETIYGLARRSYFAEKRQGLDKKSDELLHTENMVIVDRQGRLRGIYNATLPVEAERAIEEIKELLREP